MCPQVSCCLQYTRSAVIISSFKSSMERSCSSHLKKKPEEITRTVNTVAAAEPMITTSAKHYLSADRTKKYPIHLRQYTGFVKADSLTQSQ
ncbi:hypothetical protein L873DRAFT_1025853 [Choiromyces venosus 120613-1]|uniref:Uncharacterized protein n=1 Tax=Choiromyces venosus 120613-1 TaxID=1336337 RepID=A0A3N4JMB9_9PEZI|nr:hypothetical protein L873DRAFT_1025853 [Choiromyces venosus 120613-1]